MRLSLVLALFLANLAVGPVGCNLGHSEEGAFKHYVKGKILYERGDVDAALAELAKAINSNPDLSVAHAAIGDIYRKQGNYEMAMRSYEAACETNPYAFRPHYNLGVTYQLLADAAKTAAKVQEYIRKAINVYLRARTIMPDDFDTNLNLSACYFQLGKYELAEQYCQNAIKINPKSAEAYSNLGIIYDSQNKLWEAVRAYKDSLELDGNQPHTLLNLGSTYMRQNRLKEAVNVLEIAAERDAKMSEPYEQLGVCHFRMGNQDKAMECYKKAIEINPRSAPAYRGMGVIHVTKYVMDKKRTDELDLGLTAWRQSLEINPDQEDIVKLLRKYSPTFTGPKL